MTDATTAKDAAALQAALTEGQATATTPDDKYLAAFYQLQLGILNKDQAIQAPALDAMLDSSRTPAENLAVYNFFSGTFAYGATDSPKPTKRLATPRAPGSTAPQAPIPLLASYLHPDQVPTD